MTDRIWPQAPAANVSWKARSPKRQVSSC